MINNIIMEYKDIAVNIITTDVVMENYLNAELRVHEGSLNETKKQRGYAHFVEHLIFNNKVNDTERCVDVIKKCGCDFNAYTTYDHTQYYTEGKIDRCKIAFNALIKSFTVFNKNTLTDIEFDNEKNIVLNEIDMYSTSQDAYLACAEIREKHYNMPEVIGERDVIDKVSKNKIIEYHNNTDLNKRTLQIIMICHPNKLNMVSDFIRGIISEHLDSIQPLLRRNHSEKKMYMNKLKSITGGNSEIFKPTIMHNPEVTYLTSILGTTKFKSLEDYLNLRFVYRYLSHIAFDAIRDDGQSYAFYINELGNPSKSNDIVLAIFTQPNSVEDSDYFISLLNNLEDIISQDTLDQFFDMTELQRLKGSKLGDINGYIEVMIRYGVDRFNYDKALDRLREDIDADYVKEFYIKHFKNDMLKKTTWRIISGQ